MGIPQARNRFFRGRYEEAEIQPGEAKVPPPWGCMYNAPQSAGKGENEMSAKCKVQSAK
jgi:hypothetical protein